MTVEDCTVRSRHGHGKRGISEKDAINAVGRELSSEVRAEANHLDAELGGFSRNISSDLRGEANHLNRDITGVARNLTSDIRTETSNLSRDIGDTERILSDAVCKTRFDSVLATEQAKSQVLQEVVKQGQSADHCAERNSCRTDLLVQSTSAHSVLEDQKNKFDVAKEIWNASKQGENLMISGFKDGRYDSAQSTAAIQNSMVSGFKDGRYDSSQSTAAIQNSMVTGFKDGRYDSSQSTASITANLVAGFKDGRYDAAQNTMLLQLALKDQALLSSELACRTSKELAECCCEIREKISADGEKTRSLINETARLDAVRRELKLESEVLYLRNLNQQGR